eukprot:381696-Pyramimonas_sp.AAC.1
MTETPRDKWKRPRPSRVQLSLLERQPPNLMECGTSKEYIGEDATSMAESVQQALRLCALQLKTKLVRAQVHRPYSASP